MPKLDARKRRAGVDEPETARVRCEPTVGSGGARLAVVDIDRCSRLVLALPWSRGESSGAREVALPEFGLFLVAAKGGVDPEREPRIARRVAHQEERSRGIPCELMTSADRRELNLNRGAVDVAPCLPCAHQEHRAENERSARE